MIHNTTIDEDDLFICHEGSWPLLSSDIEFEQYLKNREVDELKTQVEPSSSVIAAILGYSKALRINKASSFGIPVEVVLN